MTAQEKLKLQSSKLNFVCIGLDTDLNKIPAHLKNFNNPILEFNRQIIEATSSFTAAYKFNLAFYESEGIKGIEALYESINLIPSDVLIIGDGKRGDIGNTSQKYAVMLYDEFRFDSATLNPYMGKDSLDPFLNYKSKLNFILALTSNTGANDFEKLRLFNNRLLYQEVIKKVREWNVNDNCGLVFGATKKDELLNDGNLISNFPLLIPGVGAQGGSAEEIVSILKNIDCPNFLINIGRGIIYKSGGEDFADKAADELKSINTLIESILR